MFEEIRDKANNLANKANDLALAALVRYHAARSAARQRIAEVIGGEQGDGYVQYLIILAGVLFVGAAVFGLFKIIQGRFEAAGSSVGNIEFSDPGGW